MTQIRLALLLLLARPGLVLVSDSLPFAGTVRGQSAKGGAPFAKIEKPGAG